MPLTVNDDILYPALRLARVTGGPGRSPSPDQVADSFASLNRMIDGWSLSRDLIYSMQADEYVLTPPKPVYTIGRATGADFVADRPTRIDHANAIIGTGGNKTYLPIHIMDSSEWEQARVRTFPITLPTSMYPDYSMPNCALHMWGIPTGSPGLELWTWQQVDLFQSETDTVLVPPGYLDACVYNLAVRLADTFGTQISPNIYSDARRALAKVKGFNQPSPAIASADVGTASGPAGDFNYMTGQP